MNTIKRTPEMAPKFKKFHEMLDRTIAALGSESQDFGKEV